jgi:hypothetical protein
MPALAIRAASIIRATALCIIGGRTDISCCGGQHGDDSESLCESFLLGLGTVATNCDVDDGGRG